MPRLREEAAAPCFVRAATQAKRYIELLRMRDRTRCLSSREAVCGLGATRRNSRHDCLKRDGLDGFESSAYVHLLSLLSLGKMLGLGRCPFGCSALGEDSELERTFTRLMIGRKSQLRDDLQQDEEVHLLLGV